MTERPELALFQPSIDALRRRAGAGTEVVARDDLLLMTRASHDPWSSEVYQVRWSEAGAEAGIAEVLRFFRERRRPFVWTITALSSPASLPERLERRGLIREVEGRMLVAPLPLVGVRADAAVKVEEVTDRTSVLAALRIQHPARQDAQLEPLVVERLRRLGTDWHAALAYLEGRPVGTARWWIDRELGALYLTGAETLPGHRQRGVYSTLVAYRSESALKDGCRFAGIIADERTSAPILLKRGFEDLGAATIFLWPPSRL